VTGSCEHETEPSGSIKVEHYEYLNDYYLLKDTARRYVISSLGTEFHQKNFYAKFCLNSEIYFVERGRSAFNSSRIYQNDIHTYIHIHVTMLRYYQCYFIIVSY
jgi:hypothetical protein